MLRSDMEHIANCIDEAIHQTGNTGRVTGGSANKLNALYRIHPSPSNNLDELVNVVSDLTHKQAELIRYESGSTYILV